MRIRGGRVYWLKRRSGWLWLAMLLISDLVAQVGSLKHPYLDSAFQPDIQGTVYAASDQPDGRILLAGSFTRVNGATVGDLIRLNRNGSLDTTFRSPVIDTGGSKIVTMAAHPDGRILLGGLFNRVNDVARGNLARLMPDGSLDMSFVPVTLPAEFGLPPAFTYQTQKSSFSALEGPADGRVLVGWTTKRGFVEPDGSGTWKHFLAESLRLQADGTQDTTYVAAAVSPLLPRDSLDRPLRTEALEVFDPLVLYRLKATGDRDVLLSGPSQTGNPFRSYIFYGMALSCTDSMLVGRIRQPLAPGDVQHPSLFRETTGGVIDTGFPETEIDALPRIIAPLRDGSVLVAGLFSRISFSPTGGTAVTQAVGNAMIFLPYPAPRNLVAGAGAEITLTVNPSAGPYQWQFNGANIPSQTNRTLVLQNIQAGNTGEYSIANPKPVGACPVTALPQYYLSVTNVAPDPNVPRAGGVDWAFDPGAGANGPVKALGLATDGKVVVGGAFTRFDNTPRGGLVRLLGDGRVDTIFSAGPGAEGSNSPVINQVAFKPAGQIVIAGNFARFDGVTRPGLAVLNANGTVDTGFDPGKYQLAANGYFGPAQLAGQTNGVLHVTPAGVIHVTKPDSLGGMSLLRYDEDSARVQILTPFAKAEFVNGPFGSQWVYSSGAVEALATAPDGRVLAAGRLVAEWREDRRFLISDVICLGADTNFYPTACYGTEGQFGVVPSGLPFSPAAVAVVKDGKLLVVGVGGIVRVNPNATLDPGFSNGTDRANFTHVAVAPDGKIAVAGEFAFMDGRPRNRIARLNADGTLDLTFDPGGGPDGPIHALAIQPDGNILIGGAFTVVDSFPRRGVARLWGTATGMILSDARRTDAGFHFMLSTATNKQYVIEYNAILSSTNWTTLTNVTGDGTSQAVLDAGIGAKQRFYRARTGP